jgi:iron complex transport system ATP-binding protein
MIARALSQQPSILVMDEPTANLDYGNMVRVISKIRALANMGYGVILTTHSPDQAFMCESTVALIQSRGPIRFGYAEDVISEQTLHEAYGIDVKVVEFFDANGKLRRMCSPLLD